MGTEASRAPLRRNGPQHGQELATSLLRTEVLRGVDTEPNLRTTYTHLATPWIPARPLAWATE
jgi:hypothetical protein